MTWLDPEEERRVGEWGNGKVGLGWGMGGETPLAHCPPGARELDSGVAALTIVEEDPHEERSDAQEESGP